MNILNRFTVQNLKLNKKRTIVTIIGIILSTALICGVAGLVASFQKTLINETKQMDGNYHTTFNNVSKEDLKYIQNNKKVESSFLTNQIGWANLDGSKNENKPYVCISEFDKNALENYGLKLLEGRMPENSNEVVISTYIKTNARVNLKIGDNITLEVGERTASDGTILTKENSYMETYDENNIPLKEAITDTVKKTYTIVGIIDRPNYEIEQFSSPGYTIITYMEKVENTANISVLYTNPKEYEANNKSIQETIKTDDVHINQDLLRYSRSIRRKHNKSTI